MNSRFIEKLNLYRKLKKNKYKASRLLRFIDSLILWTPGIVLVSLNMKNNIGFAGLMMCSIAAFFTLWTTKELPIGFFTYKYNKMINTEFYLMFNKFNGSIYDIFDKNCDITKAVLKKNKDLIESELYYSRAIDGMTIMSIDDNISSQKEDREILEIKKENISVLINSNTKIGNNLRELNELDEPLLKLT